MMSESDIMLRCYRPGDATPATLLPRIALIMFALCVPVLGLLVMLVVRSAMDGADMRKLLQRAYDIGREDERQASSGGQARPRVLAP